MDGPFYVDYKPPFIVANGSQITLTTVNQAVIPTAWMNPLGNYFNWVGKMLWIRVTGQCTSAATPGNFGINWFWGNNTAGNGTNIAAVVVAWAANQANTTYIADLWVKCRAIGTSGTLLVYGMSWIQNTGILHCPFSALATTAAIDLTAANYFSLQINRSGSTVETFTPHQIMFQALN